MNKLIYILVLLLFSSCEKLEINDDYMYLMMFDTYKEALVLKEYFNSEAISKDIIAQEEKFYIEIDIDEFYYSKSSNKNTPLITYAMKRNIIKLRLIKIGEVGLGEGVIK